MNARSTVKPVDNAGALPNLLEQDTYYFGVFGTIVSAFF